MIHLLENKTTSRSDFGCSTNTPSVTVFLENSREGVVSCAQNDVRQDKTIFTDFEARHNMNYVGFFVPILPIPNARFFCDARFR